MIEIYKNLDREDLNGEIWKTIKSFPDYQISNLGRVIGKFGEDAPNAILTKKEIIEIRKSNLTQKELSKLFGVSQSTISLIKNKKIWK